MEEKKRITQPQQEETKGKKDGQKSDEWATEALQEMDDFIESQGIYIRQQKIAFLLFAVYCAILSTVAEPVNRGLQETLPSVRDLPLVKQN